MDRRPSRRGSIDEGRAPSRKPLDLSIRDKMARSAPAVTDRNSRASDVAVACARSARAYEYVEQKNACEYVDSDLRNTSSYVRGNSIA